MSAAFFLYKRGRKRSDGKRSGKGWKMLVGSLLLLLLFLRGAV